MPISRDKTRGQWVFEFDRVVPGRGRVRTRRRLPKAWSRAEADKYDRTAVGELYAEASGIAPRDRPGIERAVALYLTDKAHLKTLHEVTKEFDRIRDTYRNRAIDELPAVARTITEEGAREGWKPATVRNRIALLRAACRWAWKRHDLCEHDPGSKVVMPQVRNEKSNFLTRREVIQLARKIQHRPTRTGVLIAFYTGMRLGEIVKARADGDVWVVRNTKNGDDAFIPVHRKVAHYARSWQGFSRNTAQVYIRAALDAIGRPDASFHTLRHSTATAILAAGESLDMVGDVLRHKDTRSTKRYAHRQRQHIAAAMGKLVDKSPTTTPNGTREKAA